jgi:hypothetical protein
MRSYIKIFVVLCLIFCTPVYAWNALGHMVIAEIAYQNLDNTARKKVDALVKTLQHEYPAAKTFMQLAVWPDKLHAQEIEIFNHWHYINFAISNDGTLIKSVVDTDNAVWAVRHLADIVANNAANRYERARFLAFLAHITADLHQPLHTVNYFAVNHRQGDSGGNLYMVRYQGKTISLHKLWDKGLGLFAQKPSAQNALDLAAVITARFPPNHFGKQIDAMGPYEWAKESAKLAKQYAYQTVEGQNVSQEYIMQGQEVVEQQAALAGYRLAVMLNQIFK